MRAGRDRLTAAVRGRYSGTRFADAANTRTLEAHTVADASVRWGLTAKIDLFGIVENTFGAEYAIGAAAVTSLAAPPSVLAVVRAHCR